MNFTVDTNVLVRAAVRDELLQAEIAEWLLREAKIIAVPTIVLCEFVWVLRNFYKFPSILIAKTIRGLVAAKNIEIDRMAVTAGLIILESGGDFADGVIAYEGRKLGGETFASFDKDAVALVNAQGYATRLL